MEYLGSEEMAVISVLLVDDDREDQVLFAEAIAQLTMPIDLKILNNGIELMQLLHSDAPFPDMVFLDLQMPMMDGEECLTDIRQEKQFETIPILIYSTGYDVSRIDRLFALGANFFLQKPLSFNDLVSSLERYIVSALRNGYEGEAVYRITT
ncbi:MAG: response regulator [Chitinophagaceae bacterium]